MNALAARRIETPPASPTEGEVGRGRMVLSFRRQGRRTAIARQFVSYPFHMTRPFHLDDAIPALLTTYQQSCSGGLYRGESLFNRFDVGPHAAAHVTTQSGTIVHDCQGDRASQSTEVTLGTGAFMALMPEPVILFPGADCAFTCKATLGEGAVLILGEAFTWYDPFVTTDRLRVNCSSYLSDISLRDASDCLLLRDVSAASGLSADARTSPIGPWSIVGTYLLAGPVERLPQRWAIEALAGKQGIVAGVTVLPNQAGLGVRSLAADSQAARNFADQLFTLGVEAALGARPALRRK